MDVLDRLAVPRRDVVVLTDRYPPDSQGGAEISLHATLRAIDRAGELIVVRFDRAADVARLERIDGIEVLVLPDQAAFPLQHRSRARQAARRTWPAPLKAVSDVGGAITSMCGRLFTAGGPLALAGAVLAEVAPPRGGIVADRDLTLRGWRRRVLRKALARISPRVIHADNHRSILLAASLRDEMPGVRMVALVRDNRFWCARHDQSGSVAGRPCRQCDLACAAADARHATWLHRGLLADSGAFRRWALSRMDAVGVTSRHLERQLTGVGMGRPVVYVGNPADALDEVSALTRGVAELPGVNVLMVGHISDNKGQPALLASREALAAAVPGVRLHLAGDVDATFRETLAQLTADGAAEEGAGARITWHGRLEREQLYALYRACQIVALPTVWAEPFGRVPIEAGLARRPVVAFGVGGHRETVVDGHTGLLVPPGDMDAFIAAIAALAGDPARRLAMGEAGQRRASLSFDHAEVARRLAACWDGAAVAPGTAVQPVAGSVSASEAASNGIGSRSANPSSSSS